MSEKKKQKRNKWMSESFYYLWFQHSIKHVPSHLSANELRADINISWTLIFITFSLFTFLFHSSTPNWKSTHQPTPLIHHLQKKKKIIFQNFNQPIHKNTTFLSLLTLIPTTHILLSTFSNIVHPPKYPYHTYIA